MFDKIKIDRQKGVYLALATALISGVAIFISKFAVDQLKDPFIFTTAKNTLTALVLFSGLFLIGQIKDFKKLKLKNWLYLIAIGIVGGSIPFLLFFKALSMTQAPVAAFMHKTLFIWVAILAVPFLKERLSKIQIFALVILLLGNVLLGGIYSWHFGWPEFLVLIATILWAAESILVKKVLKNVNFRIAAFSRMFFGSVIMLAYLVITGKAGILVHLSNLQWLWIIITAAFLVGYVTFWYSALKFAPASVVASILVLGSLITTFLNSIFITHKFAPIEVLGILSMALGIIIFVLWQPKIKKIKPREVYL